MLSFICTQEKYNALSGLAFRIADNSYMIERYGRNNVSIELAQNHNTICGLFNTLDSLGVPFWVQNAVMAWSEDWRRYKSEYVYMAFDKYLKIPEEFHMDFTAVCSF